MKMKRRGFLKALAAAVTAPAAALELKKATPPPSNVIDVVAGDMIRGGRLYRKYHGGPLGFPDEIDRWEALAGRVRPIDPRVREEFLARRARPADGRHSHNVGHVDDISNHSHEITFTSDGFVGIGSCPTVALEIEVGGVSWRSGKAPDAGLVVKS